MGVAVRPGRLADLAALTDIYNHYVVGSPATFDITPLSLEQRRGWFDHYAETGPYRLLVAEDGDALLGYASSSRFREKPAYDTTVETTVYCAPEACGRGVGAALYTALFGALAGEELHRAVAAIALPNDPSVRLHQRFGFTEVGVLREVGRKFGRYWDVAYLQRPLP